MFMCVAHNIHLQSILKEGGLKKHPVENPSTPTKIIDLSWSTGNSYVAVLRENGTPEIFAAEQESSNKSTLRLIHTINVSNVSAISFKHQTKTCLALGTSSGEIKIYDTKLRTSSNQYINTKKSIKGLEFTCDDSQLCFISEDYFIIFPSINKSNSIQQFKQRDECITLKCHASLPHRAAIGFKKGNIILWDLENYVAIVNLKILNSPVTGIAMSSCGNFVIAAAESLKLCGLDFQNRQCKYQVLLDSKSCVTCDLSVDNKYLAVGTCDGIVKIYDMKQQAKLIYKVKLANSSINKILFEKSSMKPIHAAGISPAGETPATQMTSALGNLPSKHPEKKELLKKLRATKKCKNCSRESLNQIKNSWLNAVNTEMDAVECHLNKSTVELQNFLNMEFEATKEMVKKQ